MQSRNTPAGSILVGAGGALAEHEHSENFYFNQKLPFNGASFGVSFENDRLTSSNPFVGLNPTLTSRLLIQITQPLLRNREIDSGRALLKIRRKQVDMSETQFELRAIDVVSRVELAYWDLVAARQNAQVAAETVELAREQLARNKRMIDAGSLAPVELSASEAELEKRLDDWYAGDRRDHRSGECAEDADRRAIGGIRCGTTRSCRWMSARWRRPMSTICARPWRRRCRRGRS